MAKDQQSAQVTETNFPKDALSRSVVEYPKKDERAITSNGITWYLHSASQRIQPWGTGFGIRDQQLRDFWPTEPFLAGAIYTSAIRNANYEWEITGENEDIINYYTDMLNSSVANTSFSWLEFIKTLSQEWLTQDAGMFIELVRDPSMIAGSNFKKENAPVVLLNHLDSRNCTRTGNPEKPVIYQDDNGKLHHMNWYEVVALADFASPIQKMNGIGHCAVSRVLKFAEIIQSIETYTDEKVGGRFFKRINFVSGVGKSEIEDIKARDEERADNQGLMRYMEPMIYASLDPEKPITTAAIDLADIPDNFDFDTLMRWYIANIALNTGGDYQDLAPLPSGNIGSANQSEILHRKSRGKGPANFMETFQNIMRDYVMPKGYEFKFIVKDTSEEAEKIEMQSKAIEAAAILQRSDILNGSAARAWLGSLGIFKKEILDLVPEDFGNEATLSKTDNKLGQTGDSTIAEDVVRTKGLKGVFDKIRGK